MPGDEEGRSPHSNPNPNPSPDPELTLTVKLQLHVPTGVKRKRNLPGTPDPDAEVVALSPKTLLSASTFVCEICNKEFRRDQNLQIHRRGHNLPWNFGQKTNRDSRKRVFVCPVEACIYHDPSRALGDLTGIKKHYSRKHGEKNWKCEKCSKTYAVRTDWKAHTRICGNREYECDCGTLFSRKDSFLIHRASCEALAEENDGIAPSVASINFNIIKTNTVNNELLFPSLWGHASESKDEERASNPSTEEAG